MANKDVAKCKRIRTAMPLEAGNLQGAAEKMIAESPDYLLNTISDGTYKTQIGTDPYYVRTGVPPIPETAYFDPRGTPGLIDNGATMPTRGPDGQRRDVLTTVNGIGALGCAPPSNNIGAMGFDTFYRDLLMNKWDIGPFCAWDFIDYSPEMIAALQRALREDWPRMLRQNFEYALRRRVITSTQFNYSMVQGMPYSTGGWTVAPAGQLDLGFVRRILNGPMRHHGWQGTPEVSVSQTAFETMRLNYKALMGVELESTLESNETHYIGMDVKRIRWGDIIWVINPEPMRGYLVGGVFTPIYPTTYREGTGGGLVPDYNSGYDDPYVFVDGARHKVYEVTMCVHPTAFERQAMALPAIGMGPQFDRNLFNFQVETLDRNNGGLTECNEDNMKWKYLIKHVYGWQPKNPELAFSILHEVAPNVVNIVSVDTQFPATDYLDVPGSGTAKVEVSEPGPSETSDCAIEEFAVCPTSAPVLDHLVPNVLEPLPGGAPDLDADGQYLFTGGSVVYAGPGTLKIPVERVGGTDGTFSVTVTPTPGTASAGSDYTAGASVLAWADGEGGTKYASVPILGGATNGQAFTMVASGGETAADGVDAVTVNLIN